MLGEVDRVTKWRTYLNIRDGLIVRRTPEGITKNYSSVEGVVEDIFLKEREFRGEAVMYWYLDIRNPEDGELYCLGFPYGSNLLKSIVLCLASDRGLEAIVNGTPVKIEPYFSNGYSKAKLSVGETRLDWVTKNLPPVTETYFGGRKIKDDRERMKYIASLAKNIKNAIPST